MSLKNFQLEKTLLPSKEFTALLSLQRRRKCFCALEPSTHYVLPGHIYAADKCRFCCKGISVKRLKKTATVYCTNIIVAPHTHILIYQ